MRAYSNIRSPPSLKNVQAKLIYSSHRGPGTPTQSVSHCHKRMTLLTGTWEHTKRHLAALINDSTHLLPETVAADSCCHVPLAAELVKQTGPFSSTKYLPQAPSTGRALGLDHWYRGKEEGGGGGLGEIRVGICRRMIDRSGAGR